MIDRRPAFTARRALVVILLLAAVLRVSFFIGLAAGDPQDDVIYYNNAFALYRDGPTYLDQFKRFPPSAPANPIHSFHVRPMVTYPIAAAFVLFGPGEIRAAAWGFVCSLLTVCVAYRLGSRLHDRSVGLLAALLCAFYPLEVINATRILSDVQVGLFCGLALLLLVEAGQRRSVALCVLAGVAVGGAYLANGRALVFLAVLVGCAMLQAFAKDHRTPRYAPLWLLAGFSGVFAIEALAYYVRTGDPLLSYHIQSGAVRFKYRYEPVTSIDWGPVRVSYTNGQPLELLRTVLHMGNRAKDQFGLFFVLFFAASMFSLVRRRNLLLILLAVFLCVYMEFGPADVALDWGRRELHYMMVFKQERFLLMVTTPLVVASAWFLRSIARTNQLVVIAVLGVLFVTSMAAIVRTRAFYRAGLNDLRGITDYVEGNPSRTFVGDLWAIEHVRIFTRHRANNVRVLDTQTVLDDIEGTCIMLGGSRGVELLSRYVESTLPAFAREVLETRTPPPDWKLVREIRGAHNDQRLHDFRLYCLP